MLSQLGDTTHLHMILVEVCNHGAAVEIEDILPVWSMVRMELYDIMYIIYIYIYGV